MRYSVEHQRNIAFFFLRDEFNGYDIGKYFDSSIPVIIYGFDFLTRIFYNRIKKKSNVLFFLDRAHDGESYEGTKIYSLDNDAIKPICEKHTNVSVINFIVSDEKRIRKDVCNRIRNAIYKSIYDIVAGCRLCFDESFIKDQNQKTLLILRNLTRGKTGGLKRIILAGTSYTLLLAMLYFEDHESSLFIIERYIDERIADAMKKKGMMVLYEKTAVDYYDLCYMIAGCARESDIPVWGHDHMNLSRAFLENGINVLEDGLGNYDFRHTEQYISILDNGTRYYPLGFDCHVKKIVLTGQFDVPKELVNKAEIVSLDSLWNGKVKHIQEDIYEIMCFPYREITNEIKKGDTVLFLTESNVSTGDKLLEAYEQIELYKEILSNYKGKRVLIKPHPADVINYELIFPECYILPSRFPIQLIGFVGSDIDLVVMMRECSCKNYFVGRCRVDVYDKNVLVEHVGIN